MPPPAITIGSSFPLAIHHFLATQSQFVIDAPAAQWFALGANNVMRRFRRRQLLSSLNRLTDANGGRDDDPLQCQWQAGVDRGAAGHAVVVGDPRGPETH